MYKYDSRLCVLSNTIAKPTPIFNNFYIWQEYYSDPLNILYSILVTNLENKNIFKDLNNNDKFNDFCKLIYHCSSKHI